MLHKVVVAPDSFKSTMSSIEVCAIIEAAVRKVAPDCEIVKIPIADGGEGTVDAYLAALGGRKVGVRVKGPDFKEIDSFYGLLDNSTAVIEMAAASGLTLTGDKPDPSAATTYGTGQLVKHALKHGCRDFIIGIGGSATNDGGVGMAAALGVRFLDVHGGEIALNGGGLGDLCGIDTSGIDARVAETKFTIVCDVNNPLYGENGAAFIFAPQKGADPEMVEKLDANLRNYAEVIKTQFGLEVQDIPGAGAAGGLGVAFVVFVGAVMKSGIQTILDAADFDRVIRDADFVITGEGRMDRQTLMGKVPVGVARRAKCAGIPVIAIVGQIKGDISEVYSEGISAVFATEKKPANLEEIKKTCRSDLAETAEYVARILNETNMDSI